MIVDAHQHFWALSRGDYPWPNEEVAPIFRDFGPDDLVSLLDAAGVAKTVLVQATDSIAETEFLFNLSKSFDRVAGIVGWVDLTSENAIETIDHLRRKPLLKGLRPMLQGITQTNWILQDAAQPALEHMQRTGLCFDALIQPRHLPSINTLAKRYPDLRIVIDHIAKPSMGNAQNPTSEWAHGMRQLARHSNVFCKLSGMVTEIGPDWQHADLAPFAQIILNSFGAERVMFGSDWPVVNLASDYVTWIGAVFDLIADLPNSDRQHVMGQTAMQFYDL